MRRDALTREDISEFAIGDRDDELAGLKLIASAENNATVTWAISGVRTIAGAEKMQVTVGATGGDSPSPQYPLAMNTILGAKLKIILGYTGGNDIDLAMEPSGGRFIVRRLMNVIAMMRV